MYIMISMGIESISYSSIFSISYIATVVLILGIEFKVH